MKIGIGVFTGGPSGIPVSVLQTALALRAAGADLVLFATHEARLPEEAEILRGSIVRIPEVPAPLRSTRTEQALHLLHRRLLGRGLARSLASHPVDVMHLFSPGMAPALATGQCVVVQSWFWPPTLRGRLRTMMPLAPRGPLAAVHLAAETQAHVADRLGYRRADLVLANTEPAVRSLRELGVPVLALPPCIAVPDRLLPRTPSRDFRLVFCANNLATPRKGLSLLLEALPLVRGGPVGLTLVGGWDPSLADLVQRARAAGVEVEVLGRVPRERYLDLLAGDADLLVMPSLYEEWGYALFEALSRGVPGLTFDVHPFSYVLDAETGLLADARTAEALARGVERALAGGLPPPETVVASVRSRFGAQALAPRLLAAYGRARATIAAAR